jgi:hypothetical protein
VGRAENARRPKVLAHSAAARQFTEGAEIKGLTFVPKKPRPSPPGLEILRAATGELILLINGRHVRGNQTMLALLSRLFDNLGTVIPYEQLCLLSDTSPQIRPPPTYCDNT